MKKPKGFETFLSDYKPCVFDSYCGEPVGWCFAITKNMSDEEFQALGKFGKLECLRPRWYLITIWLTREDAIAKYGKETAREVGARGGIKTITFGSTTFMRKELAK